MGLLNFRRKSKKRDTSKQESGQDVPELVFEQNNSISESDSNASPISFHSSSIADSFMMASSIPDITTNNLLDEILNELPVSRKTICPVLPGSSAALVIDINRSVNLKPSLQDQTTKAQSNNNSSEINSFYDSDKVDSSTLNYSKSNSSSSISTLSSTEELIPLHHISRSDPRYNIINKMSNNNEELPLIELISQSHDLHSENYPYHNAKKDNTSNQVSLNSGYTKSTIQRSPGFVIDRMKERHRQECRRSLQWSPTNSEIVVINPVRRANSLMTSSQNSRNTSHIQQQKYLRQQQSLVQENLPIGQQQYVTIVPVSNDANASYLNNKTLPVKSFSTSTNRTLLPLITSENGTRHHNFMRPIQETPQILDTFSNQNHRLPVVATPPFKSRLIRKPICSRNANEIGLISNSISGISNNLTYGKPTNAESCSSYTNPKCHAKKVTQLHHTSSVVSKQKKAVSTVKIGKFDSIQQNLKDGSTGNNIRALTVKEEKIKNLNNVFKNRTSMNPKLKTEYRRMQVIKARSYSVPNLTQLLDNKEEEESDETQRRKSLENGNPVTKPVALISKDSTSNRKGNVAVRTDNELNQPRRPHCCYKISSSSIHHCHHHGNSFHKKQLPNYCKHNCYANTSCCNSHYTYCCKLSSQEVNTSLKILTPPKRSTSITSPSASKQPHVVQNVRYDSLEIGGKNLYLCNVHRPVCQTCRH